MKVRRSLVFSTALHSAFSPSEISAIRHFLISPNRTPKCVQTAAHRSARVRAPLFPALLLRFFVPNTG